MNEAQKAALEAVAGRSLTEAEIVALGPHLAERNDIAMAEILSVGRIKHGVTAIGAGSIIAAAYPRGGDMLDAIDALGGSDRNVYWGMDPVRRGALDLSIPAARMSLLALKSKLPGYEAEMDKVLMIGTEPDPIHFDTVSRALNAAEGRLVMP